VDVARLHFEEANKAHERIGARLMHAHSLCDETLFLERLDDARVRDRAEELRRKATDLALELGLVHVQRRLGIDYSLQTNPSQTPTAQ
jgi:hypothetical protein